MKTIIYGFSTEDLLDGLGLAQRICELSGEELEALGFIVGAEPDVDGFDVIYKVGYAPTDAISKAILENTSGIDIFIGPATKNGTDIATRLAAELDYPMITEVVDIDKVDDEIILKRQIIGGRGLAYYKLVTPITLTVPRKKFQPSKLEKKPEVKEVSIPEARIRIIEELPKEKGEVDIEAAEIVVGVGRGFKSKEDIQMALELAKLMGGELGCSRPIAADFHWLGEDRWIGISGKKIKGKLYFAIGISGAPQHIMAAGDAKIIAAINKDKNAPIFKYADYGVVADLYQFIPVLIERLKKRRG